MSNKIRLPVREQHVGCPTCGRIFASREDHGLHQKMVAGELMCLDPRHGILNMYWSRGAWRRPRGQ